MIERRGVLNLYIYEQLFPSEARKHHSTTQHLINTTPTILILSPTCTVIRPFPPTYSPNQITTKLTSLQTDKSKEKKSKHLEPSIKMKFVTTSILLTSASIISSAAALQTIFLGTITLPEDKYSPEYYAWFSDAPVCDTGSFANNPYFGSPCDEPITILGHDGILFTGCPPATPGSNAFRWPTGVSDGGNPALTCAPYTADDVDCTNPGALEQTVVTYIYCT